MMAILYQPVYTCYRIESHIGGGICGALHALLSLEQL